MAISQPGITMTACGLLSNKKKETDRNKGDSAIIHPRCEFLRQGLMPRFIGCRRLFSTG